MIHSKRIYLLLFFLYILLPVMVILVLSFSSSRYLEFPPTSFSFKWYETVFSSPKWISSALLSLKVAFLTSISSTFFSLLFVLGLQQFSERLKRIFLAILILPLLMPMIIIAISLFFWFSNIGIVGGSLPFVLAHIIISVPVSIWILNVANEKISDDIENTALTLGYNYIQAFLKVRLPLLKYNILISMLLAFIISFDEPVIALFLSGIANVTLPKAMWDGIRYEIDPSLIAISSLMMLFTSVLTGIILFIEKFKQKKHGQILTT